MLVDDGPSRPWAAGDANPPDIRAELIRICRARAGDLIALADEIGRDAVG